MPLKSKPLDFFVEKDKNGSIELIVCTERMAMMSSFEYAGHLICYYKI